MNKELLELYKSNDPAGLVPESELESMGDIGDPAGGTTWACAAVTIITGAITCTMCSTTSCTSRCGK